MKKFLFLLLFLAFGGVAGAQSLVVLTRDGSEQAKNLSAVQNLTFTANNLIIKNGDGTANSWSLSEIRKIYFKQGTTGTETMAPGKKGTIAFFPNPVGNSIHLENLPEGISDVTIYRSDGAVILRTQVSTGNSILGTGHLNRGIYILMVRDQVMKFVKL